MPGRVSDRNNITNQEQQDAADEVSEGGAANQQRGQETLREAKRAAGE